MTASAFAQVLEAKLGQRVATIVEARGETTIEVLPENWLEVARTLRDDAALRFEQAVDVCGVDYLSYGDAEWDTTDVSSEGFSRGVEGEGPGRFRWSDRPHPSHLPRRFAVVVHLLSLTHNRRLRMRAFCVDDEVPSIPSLIALWPGVALIAAASCNTHCLTWLTLRIRSTLPVTDRTGFAASHLRKPSIHFVSICAQVAPGFVAARYSMTCARRPLVDL